MNLFVKLTLGLVILFDPLITTEPAYSQQHIHQPSYTKWGRFAVDAVSKKYHGSVIDYLHVGRRVLSPNTTQETFKLWVKENGREFGVYVIITFETITEKILSVEYKETNT
jgi:hypothetical protein